MDAKAPRDLLACLSTLEDPRMARTREHRLDDILAIAILAVICGASAPSSALSARAIPDRPARLRHSPHGRYTVVRLLQAGPP